MNRFQRRKAGQNKENGPTETAMAIRGNQVVVEFPSLIKWFAVDAIEGQKFIDTLQSELNKLKTAGEQA